MNRIRGVIFIFLTVIGLPCLSLLEQKIFLNTTASMPKGIYYKKADFLLDRGDIVIFNLNNKKGHFIKYVAAKEGDEFCSDRGSLWVNGFPTAFKNIYKFIEELQTESQCQILKKGNLIVLGDHPDSYDSRYFGPIDISQIRAKVALGFVIDLP